MELSSPKRRKLSSDYPNIGIHANHNTNGNPSPSCRASRTSNLSNSPEQPSFLQVNEASLARSGPKLITDMRIRTSTSSPSGNATASTGHTGQKHKVHSSTKSQDGITGYDTHTPSAQDASQFRIGRDSDAQSGSEDQLPRMNGAISPEDSRMDLSINGITSTGSDNIGRLPAEVDSDSGDELPHPSSVHSMRSYDDAPPKGLLYSSPSGPRRRRVKKKKSHASAAATTSSPSRHLLAEADRISNIDDNQNGKESGPTEKATNGDKYQNRRGSATTERFIDDDIEDKIEQISLYQQRIAAIKEDIGVLQHQININERSEEGKADGDAGLDDLLYAIVHRYLGEEENTSYQHTPFIPLSKSLTSFLPFAKPISSASTKAAQAIPPPPVANHISYQSLKLGDPAPDLTSLTPIDFTQTISIDPDDTSETAASQLHTITFHSPGNLLNGTLKVKFDTATETISNIRLIEISKWADEELGSWIRKKILDEEDQGDINIIAWAIGRYWDVALSRARCWVRCEKAYAEIVEEWIANNGGTFLKTKKSEKKKKKMVQAEKREKQQHHWMSMVSIKRDNHEGNDNSKGNGNDNIRDAAGSDNDNELRYNGNETQEKSNQTQATPNEDNIHKVPNLKESVEDLSAILCSFFKDQDQDHEHNQGQGFLSSTNGIDLGSEISSSALLPHLGLQLLKLHGHDGDVELYINGHIEIDWTGEVTYTPDIDLAVPQPWRKANGQNFLGKVSILFQHLRKIGGVDRAIRVLLKLLYP